MFLIDIYGLFLFGLVKLIFGLPKSEEYLPEGLPGILKICVPWCVYVHKNDSWSSLTYTEEVSISFFYESLQIALIMC